MTCWMSGKSRPLEATSVATSTSFCPPLKVSMEFSRSSWSMPPWMATASTPLRRRYSWMSSTSALFSQNTSTGGGVFCRHSSRYTSFASCFTYSTSWMTSRLAAPARPTLQMTGSTRAVSANFRIFMGMVALKRSVCRWLLKCPNTSRMSSSKPRSTMRSASSRQRYLHRSSDMRFLCSRSFSRPGVATHMCSPCLMISHCSLTSTPPMQSIVRILL
mmetsp:Transcript_39050/g.84961  ORF Transcript_39050/g.84961 Transcript_39050/m.84961 type:complete len:217 (-) Transcript_39050:1306-1956(-)